MSTLRGWVLNRADEMVGALERLVAPPPSRTRGDWAHVESVVHPLPPDYKDLVDRFGVGAFDEFLWLLGPTTNRHLDLATQTTRCLDALRELGAAGEALPFSPDGLSPWALTDNGDVCYWVRRGPNPVEWIVAVNESRGPAWELFETTAAGFLYGLLSRELVVSFFPEDFPSDPVRFAPH